MVDFASQSIVKQPNRPRYNIVGHEVSCTGHLSLGVRHESGKYRIVRACACGATSQEGLHLFDTHAEAWAVRKLLSD